MVHSKTSSVVTRSDLINSLQKQTLSKDKQLYLLRNENYEELIDVISDSFLNDPLMVWTAGLDENKLIGDDGKKRKELQLRLNRFLFSWLHRPLLIRKKGIVMGVKADKEEDGSPLAGVISIMPGNKSIGVFDVFTNMMLIGPPPFYTKEKVNYGPNGDKKLKSMAKLVKKRSEVMKKYKSNYIVIETLGVSGSYQGKGLGGKLLRPICKLSDSLNVPLYLETESEGNEALYHYFGFQTVETVELEAKGSLRKLKMWLMVRLPQKS
mmetsp:Transcript_32105/g.48473  ORF Transcript_32105/g.48473 Transcript_32105/m.48473 type:complete len:266 (+) Transcript_32105:74-871(+)